MSAVPAEPHTAVHLLVESRGPWAGPSCASFLNDALALVRTGAAVRLFLVQDGAAAAVPGAVAELPAVLGHGGEVWVDRFSASQRGLRDTDVHPGVRFVDMAEVADAVLAPDTRVVWH